MKSVLVTGGAGYIGSHTCKALLHTGYLPVTFDNLVYGHDWAVKWGPLVTGDILNRDQLDAVFRTYRFDAVIHFAAYAYVGESVADPGKYYNNNTMGTLTLLDAMRHHGVDKIIFSSTCATYGNPTSMPISEDHGQAPVNPYGASKLMIERILSDYNAAYGMNSIALRYFNAAGADPEGAAGESHDPETHLIPLALNAASGNTPSITVFGNDYDTPDGTCIRDYTHVSDIANAHLLALKALEQGERFNAYNLGSGQGFSVKDVLERITRITNRNINVINGSRRAGDPACLVSDARKVRDELGWEPGYSDMDSIIETAWRWHLNRHEGPE